MTLPAHFFISDCGGTLHDTRVEGWSNKPPLRANYEYAHRDIKTVADFKATLRHGRYTNSGYPLYFITMDGAALSFETARNEFRQIAYSIANQLNDGWLIIGCDINYEDTDLRCEHSGKLIESAYGE